MSEIYELRPIAHVRSDFGSKFGVPRQSGLVDALTAAVVFEEPYRNPDALRGLEGFSHIWLIWVFHQSQRTEWSPTVRPPRLGGNRRVGVFASRSPFRPNPIGTVLREAGGHRAHGPVRGRCSASGARIWWTGPPSWTSSPISPTETVIRTPPAASPARAARPTLAVEIPPDLLERLPADRREALREVLALDPPAPVSG